MSFVLAVGAAACSGGVVAPSGEFSVVLPERMTPSRADVEDVLEALTSEEQDLAEPTTESAPTVQVREPDPPPSVRLDSIPASVFEIESAVPRRGSLDWKEAVQLLRQTIEAANENGWCVHILGYTDSIGAADFNQVLSEDRASSAAKALEADLSPIMFNCSDTVGCGIGGDSPDWRKVVIEFSKTEISCEAEETQ